MIAKIQSAVAKRIVSLSQLFYTKGMHRSISTLGSIANSINDFGLSGRSSRWCHQFDLDHDSFTTFINNRYASFLDGKLPQASNIDFWSQKRVRLKFDTLILLCSAHLNNRSAKNELVDHFLGSAQSIGIKTRLIETDLVSYGAEGSPQALEELELNLKNTVARSVSPLVLIVTDFIPTPRTLNAELVRRAVAASVPIVLFLPDAQSSNYTEIVSSWESVATLATQMVREDKYPPNYFGPLQRISAPIPLDDRLYFTDSDKRYDVSFIGGIGTGYRCIWLSRLILLASSINIKLFCKGQSSSIDRVMSQAEYSQIYRQSRMAVNFSQRVMTDVRIITGRVWETLACGCLLFEQENDEIEKFFTPFIHYIPFETWDELQFFIHYFSENSSLRERISTAGSDHYRRYFGSNSYWNLVSLLS